MPNELASPVDFLLSLLADKGDVATKDGITRLEHGLQCAANAEQSGADEALVAASLLHDVGTLLRTECPDMSGDPTRGHEVIGAEVLGRWFGPEVTEPVALHVMAKRYLVGQEAGYAETLGPASVASLENQGLPLTATEGDEFLAQPFAQDALALRRWDEAAKSPGASTPRLDHFRPALEACLKTSSAIDRNS